MEVKFGTGNTDFFKRLRSEVGDYFKKKNMNSTGGVSLWIKALLLCAGLVGIYLWVVAFTPESLWILFALYVFMGIVVALIGFNIMHDGAHGAFSKYKFINRIMANSLNVLGGSSFVWNRKHNISHHSFTNIEAVDDDVDLGPLIRLHPGQKKRWWHRYQHIYAMPLYTASFMNWIYISDFKKYFSGKVADLSPMHMDLKDHLSFWMSKTFHLAVFLLLPMLMIGFVKAIAGYLVALAVIGFIIAIIFQLAHIVEGTEFTPTPESGSIDIQSEWAVHQVNTTVNFAMQNKMLTWMLGGLNFQMIHHLFPKVSHVHYPAIRPIILSVCRQYNLHYVEFPGFFSALRSHLRHLKKAGRA